MRSRERYVTACFAVCLIVIAIARSGSACGDGAGRAARNADAPCNENLGRWRRALDAGDWEGAMAAVRDTKSLGGQAVSPLIATLRRGDDPKGRVFAAIALREFGQAAADARPQLLDALKGNDPTLIVACIEALNNVSPYWSNGNVEILAKLARDGDNVVRAHAIAQLGATGERGIATVPLLINILHEDCSNNCRMHAAMALGNLAPKEPRVITSLIRAVEGGSGTAIDALLRAGPEAKPAIPCLMRIVGQDGGADRASAARVLGRIGPSAGPAVPILIRRLADRDSHLASECADALGRIGAATEEVAPSLIRTAESGEMEVRRSAVRSLGLLGPSAKRAIPLLCRLVEDKNSKLRPEAARAIGMIDAPGSRNIPRLTASLADTDLEVQSESAVALALLGVASPDVLQKLSRSFANRNIDALLALRALAHQTEHFSPTFLAMAHDADPSIRAYGVRAIGFLRQPSPRVLAELSARLGDESEWVRLCAAQALGKLGPRAKTELPALTRALKDDDWMVQEAAKAAIGEINGGE